MKCANCNQDLPDDPDLNFCPWCMTPNLIETVQQEPPQQEPPQPEEEPSAEPEQAPPKPMNKILAVILRRGTFTAITVAGIGAVLYNNLIGPHSILMDFAILTAIVAPIIIAANPGHGNLLDAALDLFDSTMWGPEEETEEKPNAPVTVTIPDVPQAQSAQQRPARED
jgi:hypothetical protein